MYFRPEYCAIYLYIQIEILPKNENVRKMWQQEELQQQLW